MMCPEPLAISVTVVPDRVVLDVFSGSVVKPAISSLGMFMKISWVGFARKQDEDEGEAILRLGFQ
jgi:hypothetical protein